MQSTPGEFENNLALKQCIIEDSNGAWGGYQLKMRDKTASAFRIRPPMSKSISQYLNCFETTLSQVRVSASGKK